MVVQCCVCQRVRHENEWVPPTNGVAEARETVSHGYCPRCAAQAFDQIKQLRVASKRPKAYFAT